MTWGFDPNDAPRQWRSPMKLAFFVAMIVVAAVYFMDWDTRRATAAASEVLRPTTARLDAHLESVSKALGPGGPMYEAQRRQEARDRFLVDSVAALCRATPRAACPSPTGLVSPQ